MTDEEKLIARQERIELSFNPVTGGVWSEEAKNVVRKLAAAFPDYSVFWQSKDLNDEPNVHFCNKKMGVQIEVYDLGKE